MRENDTNQVYTYLYVIKKWKKIKPDVKMSNYLWFYVLLLNIYNEKQQQQQKSSYIVNRMVITWRLFTVIVLPPIAAPMAEIMTCFLLIFDYKIYTVFQDTMVQYFLLCNMKFGKQFYLNFYYLFIN
jgi:hypothetical protein